MVFSVEPMVGKDGSLRNYTPDELRRFVRLVEHEDDTVKARLEQSIASLGDEPDNVYHYTNHDALVGILQSKKLWASKFEYLNDRREMHHGVEIFRDILGNFLQLFPFREDEEKKDLYETWLRMQMPFVESEFNPADKYDLYSASFCAARDQSSAWLSYGDSGHGYALGFSHRHLKNAAKGGGFTYQRVIYNTDTIRQLILEGMIEATNRYFGRLWDERMHHCANSEWHSWEIYSNILLLLPFFKQRQWEDEREFRVLLTESTQYPLQHRRTTSVEDIPYIEFTVHTHRAPKPFHYLPITEIVVGSKVSSEQLNEIENLINYTEYGDVILAKSEVQLS